MTYDDHYFRDEYLAYYNEEQQGAYDEFERKGYELCLTCSNADGPYMYDKCDVYKMPLYMCGRRKKCKHYEDIPFELDAYEYFNDNTNYFL